MGRPLSASEGGPVQLREGKTQLASKALVRCWKRSILTLRPQRRNKSMKLFVEQGRDVEEVEVVIRCRSLDREVSALLERLRSTDHRLTGVKDGATQVIEVEDVLYIDTADRITFLYTANGVYETQLRLYELEERLLGRDFLRVSKSAIINFDHVRSLRPDLGGRMRLTMSNGEVVMANRQYVGAIKAKLGLGKGR